MARIINVYTEEAPALTLVGIPYFEADMDAGGGYASKWMEWFREGRFERLEDGLTPHTDAYIGAMRMNGGVFEYWIGILTGDAGQIPEGYRAESIPASRWAVAWIKGKDGPEIYSMHEQCMAAFAEAGLEAAKSPWYIERYACPRFTEADENGEVILDYMVAIG